jgi:murein DD-endopeptidase MepM/ murein hydrolase activator NlpD
MAAKTILQEKEHKIVSTSMENSRIKSEFALLKRDLLKMMDQDGEAEDMSDYSKFVIEQYKDEGGAEAKPDLGAAKVPALNHGVVLERIAFLEQKVEAMKQDHERVLEAIHETTKGKISEYETIIKRVGLNSKRMAKIAEEKQDTFVADGVDEDESEGPQGGPFDPVSRSILMEYNEALYDDMREMMLLGDVVNNLPLGAPMKSYRITSGYGMRVDPFRRQLARHGGLDFAGPTESKVYATSDGVVRKAGRRGAYGMAVEIEHEYGLSTVFGHLSKILVKPGMSVKKGQAIGIQGSTGRSTGAHLHYEVRNDGRTVDPADFLKAAKHVRKTEEN